MKPEEVDRDDPRNSFVFDGIPMCWSCYWYVGAMECRAFGLEPIPDDIMSFGFDNRNPYPGDNGKRYVPRNADPPPEDW